MQTNAVGKPKQIPLHERINPFSENDRATLEAVLAKQHVILDLLQRAAACGLDVEDKIAKHGVHTQIAQTIKDNFFQTLPTPQQE